MWLILSLLGTIILLLWYLTSPLYWKPYRIPYLIPWPIIGNYGPLFPLGLTEFYKKLYKTFPNEPFYGMHMFTKPALFIRDPELIQKIFVTDFEYFTSHGIHGNQKHDPFGGNLFYIYGQQWKEMRTKLGQYFTPAKIKLTLNYMENSLSKTRKMINKDILDKKPTEMKRIFFNITVDIICQTIFGIESDAFEKTDSVFNKLATEMFKPKATFKILFGIASPKMFDILKLETFDKELTDCLKKIIEDTIEYRKKENIQIQDYLQGMLDLMENHQDKGQKLFSDNTEVPKYDFNNLICQSILLFGAGVETTALTMTHLFYELAIHPDIQDKCRKEINSVINNDQITYNDLNKLEYVGACIQEALRVHTPFSGHSRECTKDYKLPNSDFTIKKGTMIITSSIGSHFDPAFVLDPDKFQPERFLSKDNNTNGIFYYPFGAGPRTCLGMNLANYEMKLTVARLLQNYEFSVCSETVVPLKEGKYYPLKTPTHDVYLEGRILNVI